MIDPAAQAILDAVNATPPMDQLGLAASRESVAGRPRATFTEVDVVVDLVTRISGGVAVRLYRPAGEAAVPVIVFAHGGGWILGSVESADETCRRISVAGGCAVLSVEYRLAPEDPHPAAVLDVEEVLRWLPGVQDEYGIDPGQVFLAGESSGAHVALSAVLARQSEGISGALLFCPPVDPAMSSVSWAKLGDDHIPRRSQMEWMWRLYRGPADEHAQGAPDPATADLSGMPRTVVLVAEYDPLRDEGIALARRLEAHGVETVLLHAEGQVHPVVGYAPVIPACAGHLEKAVRELLNL